MTYPHPPHREASSEQVRRRAARRLRTVAVLASALHGCGQVPVNGAAGPAPYEVRDTVPYSNLQEEGTLGVLYRGGEYVDSVDVGFGVHPVSGGRLLILPVRTIDSEDGPLTYPTSHALLGPTARQDLAELLPHFHPIFSSPAVVDGRIAYWGLSEMPEGDIRVLAMRFDPGTDGIDSVFLFRAPIATDDPTLFLPPYRSGEQLVFRSGGHVVFQHALRVWALSDQFQLVAGDGGMEWILSPTDPKSVVTASTREAELVERFGEAQVRHEEVHLGEGEYAPGTVLFPDDPLRRVEILWHDPQTRTAPEHVWVSGESTFWSLPRGITLGTRLRRLEQLNGRPFLLAGFDWDYQGTVMSWEGGALERLEGPNARVLVRLSPRAERVDAEAESHQVGGEGPIRSDHPVMQQLDPEVYEIGIIFDPPIKELRSEV